MPTLLGAAAGLANRSWVSHGAQLLLDFVVWQLFSFLAHELLSLLADTTGTRRSQLLQEEWFLVRRANQRVHSKKLPRKVRHIVTEGTRLFRSPSPLLAFPQGPALQALQVTQ